MRIGGVNVGAGQRATIDLPLARLYTRTGMTMTVHVVRGRRTGPRLLVCAGLHGDEIAGVEVIRRLLASRSLKRLKGTLVAVPVVNVYAFVNGSRYSPDRRDLNRCFPGAEQGSLTSRLAHLFLEEVMQKCTHGIDLHTGSNHRTNLPQIRASLGSEEVRKLAEAFNVPVILDSESKEGTLRHAAGQMDIPLLVYEAGEALRFHEWAIRPGLRGVLELMRNLQMLPAGRRASHTWKGLVARRTTWVRAPISGIFNVQRSLGTIVKEGETLATVGDPFAEEAATVVSPLEGIIIGVLKLPLVHQGDALFHLAALRGVPESVAEDVELTVADMLPPDW